MAVMPDGDDSRSKLPGGNALYRSRPVQVRDGRVDSHPMAITNEVCSPAEAAIDPIGRATLEIFAENENYTRFIWRSLQNLVLPRGKVLELGCGIGNLTRLILEERGVTSVHGVDMDPVYVERLLAALADPRLSASAIGFEKFSPPDFSEAADESYDTIVCSNVLEHIEDDRGAMVNIARMLRPGGEALILVPAHHWLFCDLDRNLSHYRRYSASDLHLLEEECGLEILRVRYFNPLGVLGWWVNGKVLGRGVLPAGQVSIYSRFAIPVSSFLDRLNPFSLGISLLALFRKRET